MNWWEKCPTNSTLKLNSFSPYLLPDQWSTQRQPSSFPKKTRCSTWVQGLPAWEPRRRGEGRPGAALGPGARTGAGAAAARAGPGTASSGPGRIRRRRPALPRRRRGQGGPGDGRTGRCGDRERCRWLVVSPGMSESLVVLRCVLSFRSADEFWMQHA